MSNSMHVSGGVPGWAVPSYSSVDFRPWTPQKASVQARHMARLARYVGLAESKAPVVVAPADMDRLLLGIQELCLGRTFSFTADMLHQMQHVLEMLAAQIGQQDAVSQATSEGILDAWEIYQPGGGQ